MSYLNDGTKIHTITLPELTIETLDFKKHWNKNWRKSNVEAAKMAAKMMKNNEQGLIVVAKNKEWKNGTNMSTAQSIDYSFSFLVLINNNKIEKKDFVSYWMYVIKSELIILDDITIDGNLYAVDCTLQCKDKVMITTQLFVTEKCVIDSQLKQCISPIPWNTKMHHDIPLQLQCVEDKAEQCSEDKSFDKAVIHLQEYLQLCIDLFGASHHYVAVAYNLLALAYHDNGQHNQAIEPFKKALKILLDIFGANCKFVAQLYHNMGVTYSRKEQYNEATECNEKSLKITLDMFESDHDEIANSYYTLGNTYVYRGYYDEAIRCYESALKILRSRYETPQKSIGDIYWNLAITFEQKGEVQTAYKNYEDSWKICSIVLGNWHHQTLQAKKQARKLSEK
ncbi:hypothetical protein RFI_01682, partial [Reticulomyxa filosa]